MLPQSKIRKKKKSKKLKTFKDNSNPIITEKNFEEKVSIDEKDFEEKMTLDEKKQGRILKKYSFSNSFKPCYTDSSDDIDDDLKDVLYPFYKE